MWFCFITVSCQLNISFRPSAWAKWKSRANCTIRIHLIIDSARQKVKNKETGRYSNSSYQASRVLICTWTAAIILGSPLPSAAKCTTSHQPHGARLKATTKTHLLFPASFCHSGRGGDGGTLACIKRGATPSFLSNLQLSHEKKRSHIIICAEDTRLLHLFSTWKFWICPKYHSCAN